MNDGRFDSDDAYATPQKERVQQSQPYEQPRIRKTIHWSELNMNVNMDVLPCKSCAPAKLSH